MNLKIYSVVLELVRRLAPHLPLLRARSIALGDQLERALISVPLNVAEDQRAFSPRDHTGATGVPFTLTLRSTG